MPKPRNLYRDSETNRRKRQSQMSGLADEELTYTQSLAR